MLPFEISFDPQKYTLEGHEDSEVQKSPKTQGCHTVLYPGAIEKQEPLKYVIVLVDHVKHHPEKTEHYRDQLVVVHFRLHVDYATTGICMAVWVYELLAADSIAHV